MERVGEGLGYGVGAAALLTAVGFGVFGKGVVTKALIPGACGAISAAGFAVGAASTAKRLKAEKARKARRVEGRVEGAVSRWLGKTQDQVRAIKKEQELKDQLKEAGTNSPKLTRREKQRMESELNRWAGVANTGKKGRKAAAAA